MTLYIYPRTQTGCKSSWWDTHAVDICNFIAGLHWKLSATSHIGKQAHECHCVFSIVIFNNNSHHKGMFKKKIIKFHVSFHFLFIHFSFYFFFNAFPPKITLGPWQGKGVGVHGEWGVFICRHGHRAKKWCTVGQKVTYSGQKCDVPGAEKWRMGQNATFKCYNTI